jgi:hypothetical protein
MLVSAVSILDSSSSSPIGFAEVVAELHDSKQAKRGADLGLLKDASRRECLSAETVRYFAGTRGPGM